MRRFFSVPPTYTRKKARGYVCWFWFWLLVLRGRGLISILYSSSTPVGVLKCQVIYLPTYLAS